VRWPWVGWVSMPYLRGKVCMAYGQRPVTLLDVPASDLTNSRNDL